MLLPIEEWEGVEIWQGSWLLLAVYEMKAGVHRCLHSWPTERPPSPDHRVGELPNRPGDGGRRAWSTPRSHGRLPGHPQ